MSTTGFLQGGCQWCSNPSLGSYVVHSGGCPKVAEVEYHRDGSIKRVVFHHPETSAQVRYVCGEPYQVLPDVPPELESREQPTPAPSDQELDERFSEGVARARGPCAGIAIRNRSTAAGA